MPNKAPRHDTYQMVKEIRDLANKVVCAWDLNADITDNEDILFGLMKEPLDEMYRATAQYIGVMKLK